MEVTNCNSCASHALVAQGERGGISPVGVLSQCSHAGVKIKNRYIHLDKYHECAVKHEVLCISIDALGTKKKRTKSMNCRQGCREICLRAAWRIEHVGERHSHSVECRSCRLGRGGIHVQNVSCVGTGVSRTTTRRNATLETCLPPEMRTNKSLLICRSSFRVTHFVGLFQSWI